MRKHFSKYIEQIASAKEDLVFITGDLGYNALENVQTKMGDRFINAGVAEQNMISMAAGMASQGFQVICYSIAPFVVYRCLEQIRNDVCFHKMPVYIIGNGGGYGYGIMGATHHTLEDIAILSSLQDMKCYVPAFIEDLYSCMDEIISSRMPCYLRLGIGNNMEQHLKLKQYGAFNENDVSELTIISQGPVTNNVIDALKQNQHTEKIAFFIIDKMPLTRLPAEIKNSILKSKNILTVEEHVSIGGLGTTIASLIVEEGIAIHKFKKLCAKGYPNGLYGSQSYHQEQSGLDVQNISEEIKSFF